MAGIPVVALFATLFMQALCTMAVFSMPVVAPIVSAELGIPQSAIGLYAASVYGLGMASAVLSPGFIHRYGAVRVSQYCIATAMAGLVIAATAGGAVAIALSALAIAAGYGATAPSSSHLIVKRTAPGKISIVLSLRQTGVPLGAALTGILVPPLLLRVGWRDALLIELIPCLLMLALLQAIRHRYDDDRDPHRSPFREGVLRPLRLVVEDAALRRLSIAAFFYSGAQLCFGAFMVVYLHGRIGIDLVRAGQALAAYQIAGVLSRIVLGYVADVVLSPRTLLGCLGLLMAAASIVTGLFAADWPFGLILGICVLAGATASGFTGIAYAEYSRLGGAGRTAEATGAGAFAMFFGSMALPALASFVLGVTDSYTVVFTAVALLTGSSGAMLLASRPRVRAAP